ncbi:MAG: hypothetical protein II937_13610 [Bacteroidales bacterium]|nr:hypothetical protein [Bacteroidales bacterium]
MGLYIKCKKTGTTYYLGYGGMLKLRIKVAELFDKKLGYLYKDALCKIGDKRKEALSAISLYANQHKPVSLKVWNFLFLPDTGAEITYGCCKEIYDGINGKCDDFVIGYAAQDNPFTWNQFVELLKECYENKSKLIWR